LDGHNTHDVKLPPVLYRSSKNAWQTKTLKTLYRKKLLLNLLSHINEVLEDKLRKITTKDVEAWDQVRIQTITTSFRHLLWLPEEKMLHFPLNNVLDEDDIP